MTFPRLESERRERREFLAVLLIGVISGILGAAAVFCIGSWIGS